MPTPCHKSISPLEGEMPGRAEGVGVHTIPGISLKSLKMISGMQTCGCPLWQTTAAAPYPSSPENRTE